MDRPTTGQGFPAVGIGLGSFTVFLRGRSSFVQSTASSNVKKATRPWSWLDCGLPPNKRVTSDNCLLKWYSPVITVSSSLCFFSPPGLTLHNIYVWTKPNQEELFCASCVRTSWVESYLYVIPKLNTHKLPPLGTPKIPKHTWTPSGL